MRLYIFFLNRLIKLLNILPFGTRKLILVNKLIKLKSSVDLYLFDDNEFLNYVYKKKMGIERRSKSISTLALRASTTDYGFYSPLWEGAFNLGLTSSDLFNTYHLYKYYRNNLPNLKNVIVFFSVSAPGFSLIHSIERYRTVAYKYFFQVPYSTNGYINHKFEKRVFKKCKNLKIPDFDSSYCGYEKKSYYGIDITTEERVRTHLRENKREPSQMNWLKSLFNLVYDDGRVLVVVIPPYRSDYKNLLTSDLFLFEKLFKFELDGLKILNFYNSDKFDDTDFGDTDHLNETGAVKMTNELRKIFEDRKWI